MTKTHKIKALLLAGKPGPDIIGLGFDPSMVSNCRRQLGFEPGVRGRKRGGMNRPTRAKLRTIRNLRQSGFTWQQIGDVLKMTRQGAHNLAKEHKINLD